MDEIDCTARKRSELASQRVSASAEQGHDQFYLSAAMSMTNDIGANCAVFARRGIIH
jgi:hypothetical protein